MISEAEILYETGDYYVTRGTNGKGFKVFRNVGTHAVRCAVIGYDGDKGLNYAKAEADRRSGLRG